ncbi:MAG: hypothetical protein IPI58_09080 [Alphaproteobacteria bacterium]|nr:MAG: hypothetical protein IPI58_09080 [Alphaproteobacteria bacterium]
MSKPVTMTDMHALERSEMWRVAAKGLRATVAKSQNNPRKAKRAKPADADTLPFDAPGFIVFLNDTTHKNLPRWNMSVMECALELHRSSILDMNDPNNYGEALHYYNTRKELDRKPYPNGAGSSLGNRSHVAEMRYHGILPTHGL